MGSYIQKLRNEREWNVRQLADKAGVSYKTLSKLELGRITPRKPDILMKVAHTLDVHPDRLLLLAPLTPMLRPVADNVSAKSQRELLNLLVSKDERRQLENYLQFLRYMALVEALSQQAETEAQSSNQHLST